MMFKLFALFWGFLIIFGTSEASENLICYNGTIVYDATGNAVRHEYLSSIQCYQGLVCAQATFEVEGSDGLIFQAGFCSTPFNDSCDLLTSYLPSARNCQNPIRCSTSGCNNFSSPACSTGAHVYDPNSHLLLQSFNTSYVPAAMNGACMIYTYLNFDPSFNFTSVVQIGAPLSYVSTIADASNCEAVVRALTNMSSMSMNASSMSMNASSISNCNISRTTANFSSFFVPIPINSGYRCDQGVFVYSEDMSTVYQGINITSGPCARDEACGMYRFMNTDSNGNTAYIESGFCVNPYYAQTATCDFLAEQPEVGTVANCTVNICSGSFCDQFSNLEAKPGCPIRPKQAEIQALPGCTARYALASVAYCMTDYFRGLPYQNAAGQCRTNLNSTLSCLSSVVQTCVRFDSTNQSEVCNSVLTGIPGIPQPQNLTAIFRMIESIAANVTSIESLVNWLQMNPNTAENASLVASSFCPDSNTVQMILDGLSGLQIQIPNISLSPICSDDKVLNDLTEWGIMLARDVLSAENHGNVCLAYNAFHARVRDAVINRCGGIRYLGAFLGATHRIDSYYTNLIQRGVDIVLEFLNNLDFPGCEGTPSPIVCNNGTIAYTLDRRQIVFREGVGAVLCEPNSSCGMFSFVNEVSSGRAYVETAFCSPPGYTPNCRDVENNPETGTVTQCSSQTCNNSPRCVAFTNATDGEISRLPNCSRFYSQQGSCGARQGWLCDYVSWKVEFLTVWLREFREYLDQNSILLPVQLPGCIELSREGLCEDDHQAHCVQTNDGCQLCYCRDLRFREPFKITNMYRNDQKLWRRFFYLYQQFTRSSDTCGTN